MATNLAEKAVGILCMGGEIDELTPKQRNALHILKHDVIGGIFRLYQELPPNKADPILERYFDDLIMKDVGRERRRTEGDDSGSGKKR